MKKFNIAVIGATGNVGKMILHYLSERDFPINNIDAYASTNSSGNMVDYGHDKTLRVKDASNIDYTKYNIAFFAAGSDYSKKYAEKASLSGCIVIDKSSYFRLNEQIPLIVPEVNQALLKKYKDSGEGCIIANPNCCTIPLTAALKPLDNVSKIKRIVVSTYQSVSGAGKAAMDELYSQTKAKYVFEHLKPEVFQQQIAFNLFPHIGDFREDGSTEEEYKIAEEFKKIMDRNIPSSVTCVRVPVFVSHAMSVNVSFEQPISAEDAYEILSESDGLLTYNNESHHKYATPVDVTENDEIYVSRIREDHSQENTLNLWIVADNLRKGAALNAVQIAELLI